jgi:hypothetical protein
MRRRDRSRGKEKKKKKRRKSEENRIFEDYNEYFLFLRINLNENYVKKL